MNGTPVIANDNESQTSNKQDNKKRKRKRKKKHKNKKKVNIFSQSVICLQLSVCIQYINKLICTVDSRYLEFDGTMEKI